MKLLIFSVIACLVGSFSLEALPPELGAVRGFLKYSEGPIENFVQSIESIFDRSLESNLLTYNQEEDIYRADYIFDGSDLVLFLFRSSIANLYPWTRSQLCSDRDMFYLADENIFAVALDQEDTGIVILMKNVEIDICGFLSTYLPLQAFFNGSDAGPPTFPGALGVLP